MRTLLAALTALMLLATPVEAQKELYRFTAKGFEHFKPLAEKGDAIAQHAIGGMYLTGSGRLPKLRKSGVLASQGCRAGGCGGAVFARSDVL